jgi:hypothetical protein
VTDTLVSNSYIETLEEAETFFATRLGTDSWDDATAEDQAKALKMATSAIDRLRFRGQKYDIDITAGVPDQARAFPRTIDGVTLDWNDSSSKAIVPPAVKDACCLEALALLDYYSDPGGAVIEKLQQHGATSASIAGEISVSWVPGARQLGDGLKSAEALQMLQDAGYLSNGGPCR